MLKSVLIFFSLISVSAHAAHFTFSAISDMPGEVGTVSFIFDKQTVTQERKTNVISHPEQLWFGKAKPLQSADVDKLRASFEEIFRKLKLVDNFLKNEKGEGRNTFLKGAPHGLRFMLDGQIVLPNTAAYKDVLPLFEKLTAMNWTLDQGIVLAGSPLEVKNIRQGKDVAVKNPEKLICNMREKIRVCRASGFGPIILE